MIQVSMIEWLVYGLFVNIRYLDDNMLFFSQTSSDSCFFVYDKYNFVENSLWVGRVGFVDGMSCPNQIGRIGEDWLMRYEQPF